MNAVINAKQLRASLPKLVKRVRKGSRYTVLYRSRPAFQIVPVEDIGGSRSDLKSDSLYRAKPLGRSSDGLRASEHDVLLYGK